MTAHPSELVLLHIIGWVSSVNRKNNFQTKTDKLHETEIQRENPEAPNLKSELREKVDRIDGEACLELDVPRKDLESQLCEEKKGCKRYHRGRGA